MSLNRNLDIKSFCQLVSSVSSKAEVGDIFSLYGGIGMGKTTFVKAFAECHGINMGEVTSPTFNLVHVYDNKIWHYDLYRFKSPNEIFELDLEEGFRRGITLIEWPNIIEKILPKRLTKIIITPSTTGDLSLRDVEVLPY